jgi:hypothetical protein
VLLPFYAIGSALILDRLLGGAKLHRQLAFAWLVAAPLWSFYFMFTHPRSVLDRNDVAKTNAYLAANDHNDFVMSNVMSDGHIQTAFQRHSWPALDANDPSGAPREVMHLFEISGADYVHCIIITDTNSRFIDKALWPLAMPRGQWGITGWPYLYRRKATSIIAEYDRRVLNNLKAVKATKVLQLKNYAVYRVDRADVVAMLVDAVPAVRHIDFSSVTAAQHELFGWTGPQMVEGGKFASTIWEMELCPHKRCKTTLTDLGVTMPELETRAMGQLMIRVDPACDLALTFRFAKPSHARLSTNGFTVGPIIGDTMTFTVPAKHLIRGVNIVEVENMLPRALATPLYVSSLDLAPVCPAPSANSP